MVAKKSKSRSKRLGPVELLLTLRRQIKRDSDRKGKTKPPAQVDSSERSPFLTVGHSTLPIKEFIHLVQAHQVTCVIDVRTIPRSRHNPQFNKDSLAKSLQQAGIRYAHFPGLGGLRHARLNSINDGWRNASFRGYADYMLTPEFRTSLNELETFANGQRVAVMCAEAVPWRCHRWLIADALLTDGMQVEHIMSPTATRLHKLTTFAKVQKGRLTYPAEGD